jgi:hypothetical protein
MKTGPDGVQRVINMSDRDRKREEQLERLFAESRSLLPKLEADPGLPAHIRALAARATHEPGPAGAPRRGWAWASLAGATVAMSIVTGSYVGYQLWVSSQEPTTEQVSDSDAFAAAISQSGIADDLAGNGEVGE